MPDSCPSPQTHPRWVRSARLSCGGSGRGGPQMFAWILHWLQPALKMHWPRAATTLIPPAYSGEVHKIRALQCCAGGLVIAFPHTTRSAVFAAFTMESYTPVDHPSPRCLKQHKLRLLPACQHTVSMRQMESAEDVSLDAAVSTACAQDRSKLCSSAG